MKKEKIFQQMVLKQLDIPMPKEKKKKERKDLNIHLELYAKISSEWIMDLNETPNSIKLPEKI